MRYSPLASITLGLLSIFCAFSMAFAENPDRSLTGLPPELAGWIPWIEAGHPEWQCPQQNSQPLCLWPGSLHYELYSSNGSFTLKVESYRDEIVPLPSSAEVPVRTLEVRSERGEVLTVPVLLNGGNLSVKLPAGRFTITGTYLWPELPRALPANPRYGVVTADLADSEDIYSRRRDDSSLWLENRKSTSDSDAITINIFRRLSDASPFQMDTRIHLHISGGARSVQLGRVIPEGALPVTIQSALPYQLSTSGDLALQVTPGQYEITVLSLLPQPVTTVKVSPPTFAAWPKEETWSFQPNLGLRSVEVGGGRAISTELTQLPEEWRDGASYTVSAGGEVTLHELRRGEQLPPPNEITVSREGWIDPQRGGMTVVDSFTVNLYRAFRLDALPETALGRASTATSPLFVSKDPHSGLAGIELRNQQTELKAVSTLESATHFSAVGWDTTANSVMMTVNLPPSWQVLGVLGASTQSGSWFESWSLLEVFITILLVVASFRLFGTPAALIVGFTSLLNQGEFLAPRMLLIHLLILAVARRLASGTPAAEKLVRILLIVTFSTWSLEVLSFVKLQVTQLLFPQLQAGTRYRTILQELMAVVEGSLLTWPVVVVMLTAAIMLCSWVIRSTTLWQAIRRIVGAGVITLILLSISLPILGLLFSGGSALYSTSYEGSLEPQSSRLSGAYSKAASPTALAVAQPQINSKTMLTGPATPNWRWRRASFSVNGPVSPQHQIRLILLSPLMTRSLAAVRVVLMLGLMLLLASQLSMRIKLPETSLGGAALGRGAALILLFLVVVSQSATAEVPPPSILKELQNRLTQQQCQRERCTAITALNLTLSDTDFKIDITATSEGLSLIEIPGPLDVLTPKRVVVNGKETNSLRRSESGFLQVKTDSGTNTVQLSGALPAATAFALQFPQQPLYVRVIGDKWFVEGLSAQGTVREGIRLVQKAENEKTTLTPTTQGSPITLPTWAVVKRALTIGELVNVRTTVTRIGSTASEAQLTIPLLAGEQVTFGGTVQSGKVMVIIPVGAESAEFSSLIESRGDITLTVEQQSKVSEEWSALCDPTVACEASGAPLTTSLIDGQRGFVWTPFPGESVTIKRTPLQAIQGEFLTIDSAAHTIQQGEGSVSGSLSVLIRTTQQQNFDVRLPEGSTIGRASVDDRNEGRLNDGKVSFLLNPGDHTIAVSYDLISPPTLINRAPPISLSAPANNISITVTPDPTRWILWSWGLSWGPVVVYWAKLLVVVAICAVLAYAGLLPFGLVSAVLLGIGLTSLPIIVIGIPLLWLILTHLITAHPSMSLVQIISKLPKWLRLGAAIAISLAGLILLYRIVEVGLVLRPPMLIAGNQSTATQLNWYAESSDHWLPQPGIFSLPLWCWRAFSLFWATWLVVVVLRWLRLTLTAIKRLAVGAEPQ